jgi:predicted transcriptional regulator of viral defense system
LIGARNIPVGMLAERILAVIIEQRGISMPELRAAFPDVNPNSVSSAIGRLREEGFIICAHRGTYRPAERKLREPASGQSWRAGEIPPPPLARLMAGR